VQLINASLESALITTSKHDLAILETVRAAAAAPEAQGSRCYAPASLLLIGFATEARIRAYRCGCDYHKPPFAHEDKRIM